MPSENIADLQGVNEVRPLFEEFAKKHNLNCIKVDTIFDRFKVPRKILSLRYDLADEDICVYLVQGKNTFRYTIRIDCYNKKLAADCMTYLRESIERMGFNVWIIDRVDYVQLYPIAK